MAMFLGFLLCIHVNAVYDILKVPVSFIEKCYNIFIFYLMYIYTEGKFYVRIITSENFYMNILKKCFNLDNIPSLIVCTFCLVICYLCSAYLTERENKKYESLAKEMKYVKESLPKGSDEKIVKKCVSHMRNANNFTNFLVYSAYRKHILKQCKKGSKIDWLGNYDDLLTKFSSFPSNIGDSGFASFTSWQNNFTAVSSGYTIENKMLSEPFSSNSSIQENINFSAHSFSDTSFDSGKSKPLKKVLPKCNVLDESA